MLSHKSLMYDFICLVLNHRVGDTLKDKEGSIQSSNLNLNLNTYQGQEGQEQQVFIEFYLEDKKKYKKQLVEQWILKQSINYNGEKFCGKLCQTEKRTICCMMVNSPLNQNYFSVKNQHPNFQLTHNIRFTESKQGQEIDHYKCYHLPQIKLNNYSIGIQCRFYQRITQILTKIDTPKQEPIQQRTRSYSSQENGQLINKYNYERKNSEQNEQSGKKSLKMMYSVLDDVTLLVDEHQAERMISQSSEKDSEFIIQTIEEENTDITDWQLVGHKIKLSKESKSHLKQIRQLSHQHHIRTNHSHQTIKMVQFIQQYDC